MPGRPRDPDLESRLLSAAWTLLTKDSYDALTMSQVAAAANAHRSDVYRRWQTKAQLVTAALAEHLPPIPDADTGTLYSDIRTIIDGFAAAWSAAWMDGLVGMLADLRRDPHADVAFRKMAERRGRPMVNAIARAVQRGEIPDVPDLPLTGDLLEGPLMHRQMITRRPITPADLDAIAMSVHRLLTGSLVEQ